MREFVARAGLEDYASGQGVRFFHVAGTNGKGSVAEFAQSMLHSQGLRTGGFFSPYVVDPRERVQIGHRPIDPDAFAEAFAAVLPAAESFEQDALGGVTEFEYKMALALSAWKRARCEAVALEVGLGGRLDATNIVSPAACAIVSIGWDHMAQLGGTLGEIAWEKAGILKRGVPAVVGEMAPEAAKAIGAVAARVGAPLWRVGAEVRYRTEGAGVTVATPAGKFGPMPLGLSGARQPHNLAVATATLTAGGGVVDPSRLAAGSASAWLPGRNQRATWRGREWRLDGAHNVDAAAALRETLTSEGVAQVVLVAGMLEGHDPVPFFRELAPLATSCHLAPIDFHRTRNPQSLAEEVRGVICATPHASLLAALGAAADEHPGLTILVTGSFYLVGEAARLMADPDSA